MLMDESGYGKTRLVQFMCDLVAESIGDNNMIILKVFIKPFL